MDGSGEGQTVKHHSVSCRHKQEQYGHRDRLILFTGLFSKPNGHRLQEFSRACWKKIVPVGLVDYFPSEKERVQKVMGPSPE